MILKLQTAYDNVHTASVTVTITMCVLFLSNTGLPDTNDYRQHMAVLIQYAAHDGRCKKFLMFASAAPQLVFVLGLLQCQSTPKHSQL